MRLTLSDYLLSRLSDLLATHVGLHFPRERWGDLERGIAAAVPALGASDADSCAHRLLSSPLTHREVEILASCLTVGETYFFREQRSFEVFEQHILPELLHVREHNERRLRIWSAGCCTGEEPYSIAMLLDRLIPRFNSWNISLLATDINPEFLRKAAEGEYGEWSFRSTPAWIRQQYFQPRRAGRFKIQERIRKRVTFSCLNLADDAYPSLTNNTNAMDVIFCRNVLMYFTAERAKAAVGKLHRALVDGGWLIVSPVETSSTLSARFASIDFGGAILYRKIPGAVVPHYVNHVTTPAAHPWQESLHPTAQTLPVNVELPGSLALSKATLAARPRDTGAPQLLENERLSRAARDFANQGRLDEANAWCRQAITADKLNPAHHYLLATIQQEQGLHDDAAQSLTRALYLDPHFVLAHFALGNLRHSQGRRREAIRHFDNALASLQARPPDEVLPESEGLTAGRLIEIIASVQLSLPRIATIT